MDLNDELAATTEKAKTLVGLTLGEANEWASAEGHQIRVVREDEQWYPVTMDLRPRRINVELEAGRVVATSAG